MKGIIFNLLEEAVTEAHGAAAWDGLIAMSGASGVYTSLGSYPDRELMALVAAASDALGQGVPDILRWFGMTAIPRLAARYSAFFSGEGGFRGFILGLNTIIHAEVRKLYPGAQCPHFDFASLPDGGLSMIYRSARALCPLVEGFVQGAAAFFNEPIAFSHDHCAVMGAENCVFTLRIGSPPVALDGVTRDAA